MCHDTVSETDTAHATVQYIARHRLYLKTSLNTFSDCRQGQIGFLKTSNRINVMLSRAKHGMYILGHADTLTASKKSTMWREVSQASEVACSYVPWQCSMHLCHGTSSYQHHNLKDSST